MNRDNLGASFTIFGGFLIVNIVQWPQNPILIIEAPMVKPTQTPETKHLSLPGRVLPLYQEVQVGNRSHLAGL